MRFFVAGKSTAGIDGGGGGGGMGSGALMEGGVGELNEVGDCGLNFCKAVIKCGVLGVGKCIKCEN